MGIKPAKGHQSNLLRQEADVIHDWESSELETFLSKSSSLEFSELNQETDILWVVAQEVFDSISEERADELQTNTDSEWLPSEIDGHLLSRARDVTGDDLDQGEKSRLRGYFREILKARR